MKHPKKKKKRRVVEDFNAGGHLLMGTVLGLLLANHPAEFALVLFGSLLPDIDHQQSTLGKWNPFARFMTHRGKCHTLAGCVLLCSPFLLFGDIRIPLLVFAGCVGHLLGDKLASWLPGRKKFRLRLW